MGILTLAGEPAAKEFSGMSLEMTELAPIKQCAPTVTPGSMLQLTAITE